MQACRYIHADNAEVLKNSFQPEARRKQRRKGTVLEVGEGGDRKATLDSSQGSEGTYRDNLHRVMMPHAKTQKFWPFGWTRVISCTKMSKTQSVALGLGTSD